MYEIIFRNPAKRFLKKLDKHVQKEIIAKIEKLKENPRIGVPLVKNLSGLWRLRHGIYRIIYQIKEFELIVYIIDIGHRSNIYNKKYDL